MLYRENQIKNYTAEEISKLISKHSYNLKNGLDPLFERIGDAKIVMLGEASHGTHEYYVQRSYITRRLIEEKGFNIIGVEGDWPDCYKINRFIRNYNNSGKTSSDVLKEFQRWPTWMWANYEISALMEWLKEHNKGKEYNRQVGFYGLDVYSLWESLEAIEAYLRKNDQDALASVERALQCFEPYNRDAGMYASSTHLTPQTCEAEVLKLLQKIRENVPLYDSDPEGPFNTEQNAITAVNAEKYYRAMIEGGPESWNIRDTHMVETLERIMDFLGSDSKAVIWEHNTHIGDARATDMKNDGMVNVGELARQKWGYSDTVLVGFGSYSGSVVAGKAWGAAMQKMEVPEARKNSWEYILHNASVDDKIIISKDIQDSVFMEDPLSHRAIGVVYRPEMDHYGNYVPSVITKRYDAFIYIDKTKALHPIDNKEKEQLIPETYPWGI